MTCERFQVIAGEVARNEIMDADERGQALAHIESCDDCEQVLSSQTRLSAALGSLAEEVQAAQAPAGLEARVLGAFRARTHFVSAPVVRSRRQYRAGAAAAVLLLAVGLFAWRWYVASVPIPIEQAVSENAAVKVTEPKLDQAPAVAVNETSTRNSSTASKRISSRRYSTKRVVKPGIARRSNAGPSLPATITELREITTGFVPVGYGSALDLQEGGQMVRVELPRSALTRFGLPMNMNRADEKITADVLVGADGLARAIRFVQAIDKSTAGLRPGNERNEQ